MRRIRASRGLFLAALLVVVLCSCNSQPTTSAEDDREDDVRAETTGAEPASSAETTTARAQATGETARPAAPEQSNTQEEPELREGPATTNTATRPALGANGMVSTAHPLATLAGLQILEEGGNAYDAAVAVSAALNVVEPMMSGVGGYGAIVVYDAGSGETRFLEVDSDAPAALDPDIFHPPTPSFQDNRCGAPVVVTPGNLNAWEAMSDEYGELEWSRLFGPAIGYAENGFRIGEEAAGWIGSEYSAFPANAQEIYGRGGAPLQAGDRLVQRDLADSLRLIADRGAGAVYGGGLGRRMVADVQAGGGTLAMDDLRDNRAEWRPTISVDHRGYEVVTASRPATSWGLLLRLGIAGEFGLVPADHNSVPYVHALTEVSKRAFQQATRFADPETGEVQLDRLLSEAYWAEEAAAIDFSQASPYDPPVDSDSALSCSPTNYTPTEGSDTRQHTTHFVVADREGNVVSSTQTLGNVFGSKVMPEGTGIWLNDSLAWARFEPRGNPFDAAPGRQLPYALGPTIVTREDRPVMAIGTPGGRTILQTTPQMLTNVIDFDMDIQRAVSAPRFSFIIPNLLAVEPGIPASTQAELEAMGHTVYPLPELGNAQALTVEYGRRGEPVRFTGAADPRGEGAASGY